jgi:hypothetical protein
MQNLNRMLLALACLVPCAAKAEVLNISVTTGSLIAHPAAPFYIQFEFIDGSGTGDGNNVVVVDNIDFGAGGSAGALFLPPAGDVTGDLSTGVTLKDTQFVSMFTQSFDPGSVLSFRLSFTKNVDAGSPPDGFTFYILDNSLNPLPTLEPFMQDFIVSVAIDGSPASTWSYGADTSRSPGAGGDPIDFAVSTSAAGVPEPAMMWPVAGILLGAGICARRTLAR